MRSYSIVGTAPAARNRAERLVPRGVAPLSTRSEFKGPGVVLKLGKRHSP